MDYGFPKSKALLWSVPRGRNIRTCWREFISLSKDYGKNRNLVLKCWYEPTQVEPTLRYRPVCQSRPRVILSRIFRWTVSCYRLIIWHQFLHAGGRWICSGPQLEMSGASRSTSYRDICALRYLLDVYAAHKVNKLMSWPVESWRNSAIKFVWQAQLTPRPAHRHYNILESPESTIAARESHFMVSPRVPARISSVNDLV